MSGLVSISRESGSIGSILYNELHPRQELKTKEERKKERETRCNNRFKLTHGVGRKQWKRISLINLLGGHCVKCGFSDNRALQLDHINGGGVKHRQTFKATDTYYLYYLNNIKLAHQELQVLCANCNWIKRFENNECSLVMVK